MKFLEGNGAIHDLKQKVVYFSGQAKVRMRRRLYETLHPEIYHGFEKRPPFFEGWYYRLINAAEDRRYAIIPEIILGQMRMPSSRCWKGTPAAQPITHSP